MDLNKRLTLLEGQYLNMIKYKSICNKIGSTLDYSNEDYERESMLLRKIHQTKDWINKKNSKCD